MGWQTYISIKGMRTTCSPSSLQIKTSHATVLPEVGREQTMHRGLAGGHQEGLAAGLQEPVQTPLVTTTFLDRLWILGVCSTITKVLNREMITLLIAYLTDQLTDWPTKPILLIIMSNLNPVNNVIILCHFCMCIQQIATSLSCNASKTMLVVLSLITLNTSMCEVNLKSIVLVGWQNCTKIWIFHNYDF